MDRVTAIYLTIHVGLRDQGFSQAHPNPMTNANRPPVTVASIALFLSLVAFLLGSAPFTPALVLSVAGLPMALYGLYRGAWRRSILALYWATAALLAVPLADVLRFRVDMVLSILGGCGLILAAAFWVNYRRVTT